MLPSEKKKLVVKSIGQKYTLNHQHRKESGDHNFHPLNCHVGEGTKAGEG